MINTIAQNKYFEALTVMTKTGQNNYTIHYLLEEMFAEFDHNIIGLNYESSNELLAIIGKRFNNVNLSRPFRDYAREFEVAIDLRRSMVTQKSLYGLEKGETEKLPSGFIIPKYKSEDTNKDDIENIPEYEFEKISQKIAWLHELGVLQIIMDRSKDGEIYNVSRASKIIETFTDMKTTTIKSCLQAIYQLNKKNQRNNPLTPLANKLFIADMVAMFKLGKE